MGQFFMDNKTIGELVRRNETEYIDGTTTISKYVDFNLYENINKIEAYINSKHTSGLTDSLGREKPFFNIVTANSNVWYRATDIDRKHISIKPSRMSDVVAAYLANVHLHDWMKKDSFGKKLNDWGRTLARYGSCVMKFVEKDGELHSMVVPWGTLIIDSIDMDNDVVIEVLELTPSQLRARKGYDQEMVTRLIESATTRKTLDGQNRDTKQGYIKIFEVHGEMPLSWITDDEKDDDTYTQQMHVISYLEKNDGSGEYDEFTLVRGREKQHPYYITHLIKEEGRSMAIGAVEHLFEAQWMMNHTSKQIKDQLDLASKLIFQTADTNFAGLNALSAIESGDILIHSTGAPLTQVANNSHDITALQNYASQWKSLANEITNVSESLLGQNAPSGTAWRQTEALLQESHSLFELMTENKALALEEMIRKYIIPYLKSKMDTTEEVSVTLGEFDISQIETRYIKNEAIRRLNKKTKEDILGGKLVDPQDIEAYRNQVQDELASMGTHRFFKPSDIDTKTWKEVFKNLEWDVEVDITGENVNRDLVMTTLNTTFKVLAQLGGRPLTDDERLVLNKILTQAGSLSPLELSITQARKSGGLQLPAETQQVAEIANQGAPQESGQVGALD